MCKSPYLRAEKVSGASDTRRQSEDVSLLRAEANEVDDVPETSLENDFTGRSWCIRNGLIYAKPLHLLKKHNSEIGKPRQFKVNKPFFWCVFQQAL